MGELGFEAFRFVDWLVAAKQQLWQILPLGPTGYGDSPYASFSAFAGNPLLIGLEWLRDAGLLTSEELADSPPFPTIKVDYGRVIPYRMQQLRRSFVRWRTAADSAETIRYDTFCSEQAFWLEDFALFMALKEAHGLRSWDEWAPNLALRNPAALERASAEYAAEVAFHRYLQYQFFQQWQAVKIYANEKGVRIIGDIPIFVAYDSADTWANRGMFHLDDNGRPVVVAGVPPDYFSETGQRWGNPLYRWDEMAKDDYAWWVCRFRQAFGQVDILRVDHFRGFAAYWEVPACEPTAIRGRWVEGPGLSLFQSVERHLGRLPIIAEDLGLITPDVVDFRETLRYPGMRVLQFAFSSDASNPYLPHNFEAETVVYSGTHDNDTTVGWYRSATKGERQMLADYLGRARFDPAAALVRTALASVAAIAIAPIQDLLGLGTEARMNLPGTTVNNWNFRLSDGALTDGLADELAAMTELYGRAPRAPTPPISYND